MVSHPWRGRADDGQKATICALRHAATSAVLQSAGSRAYADPNKCPFPHACPEMRRTSQGAGIVLHEAARYDLLVWLATLGRERALRERIVDLARLEPGESVLDVGCGTGSLVIAAKRRVGDASVVHGIDASPQMLARASRKARKAEADVNFQSALAQALSCADAKFDAVLATMMFHHLPRRVTPRF